MEAGAGVISVDRWREDSQAYFLTHLHSDHTKGLSGKWARGRLFCSPVSARLIPDQFPGFDLSLLRVLDLGVPRELSLVSPANGSWLTIRVTAIDACHCPGAVMYLFQGDLGCFLHTGDFRWESACDKACHARKTLLSALGRDRVDVLYLDNTFCNPSLDFPSREAMAREVVDIITSHPHDDIVIGIDALGKEELLLKVSDVLKTKVRVWRERLKIMRHLEFGDVFAKTTEITRIRVIPRHTLTLDTLKAQNIVHPTVGILPSGLPWALKASGKKDSLGLPLIMYRKKRKRSDISSDGVGEAMNVPERCQPYVYSVPYTAHSCYRELKAFVKLVRPSKLVGLVSPSCYYINPQFYLGHVCAVVPSSDEQSANLRGNKTVNSVNVAHTSSVEREATHEETRNSEATNSFANSAWMKMMRKANRRVKITDVDAG